MIFIAERALLGPIAGTNSVTRISEVRFKMKFTVYFLVLAFLVGCQKPSVSIQVPEDYKDSKKSDKEAEEKKQLIDEYIQQVEKEQNIDEESLKAKELNPQELLENLTRESRQSIQDENNDSNIVRLIDDPLNSRFNNSTFANSLGTRLLSLQQETTNNSKFMGYQSYNDHILTQLLQGISFSSKSITLNEAIDTYNDFNQRNLFPNYDKPVWQFWGENEPKKNIEFFEVSAILTKTSLLSGLTPFKLYGDYYLPIKQAYDSYYELDNDYNINDYLNMAYLTEQYVYYDALKDMDSKTEGDFISLVDTYNCKLRDEELNTLTEKLACFKSQNYIDSSLALAQSLYSPDIQKMGSFDAFESTSNDVNSVLKQLDNPDHWKANLTSNSKLKLAGLLVWSNIYNEDGGQSVIDNFNKIYSDLMQSNVVETPLRFTPKESQNNIRFELVYPLNKKHYSNKMFDVKTQEQVQAIAIELTRNSMGLY